MRGKLTVIQPNGEIIEAELTAPPALEVLQIAVGGYIELVPGFDKYAGKTCVTYCNEEGKLNGLPYNGLATRKWVEDVGIRTDILVGPVAILTGDAAFLEAL